MRRALTAIVTIAILVGAGLGIWAQAAPGDAAAAATALAARTVEADDQGRPTDRPVRAEVTVWRVGADGTRSVRTVSSSEGRAVLGALPPGVYFAGAVPATGYQPVVDDDGHPGYANLVHPCRDLRACVLFTVDGQGGMKVFHPHGVEPLDGDLDFLFRPTPATPASGASAQQPPTAVVRTAPVPPAPAPPAATKRIVVSVFDTTPGSTNRYVTDADVLVSDPSANRVPRAGVNVHYAPVNTHGLATVAVHPSTWSVYVTLPAGYVFDGDPATKVVTVDADGGPVFGVGFRARRATTAPSAATPAPTPRSGGVTPAAGAPAPTAPATTVPEAPTTTTTAPVEPLPGEPGGPSGPVEGEDGVLRYPYPSGSNPLPTPRPGDIELEGQR